MLRDLTHARYISARLNSRWFFTTVFFSSSSFFTIEHELLAKKVWKVIEGVEHE